MMLRPRKAGSPPVHGVLQAGEEALLSALRKKMELLVLSLPSGSYAQRVRAEYLKELETRTQAAFKKASARL